MKVAYVESLRAGWEIRISSAHCGDSRSAVGAQFLRRALGYRIEAFHDALERPFVDQKPSSDDVCKEGLQ